MTIKQFFKSNAFKSLAVLMIIVIVCGGIIAIFNGLLHVSDDEITQRAVAKIFGKTPDKMITLALSAPDKKNIHGDVNQAYYIEDGDLDCLFIHSTGGNGFGGGTVSMWSIISVNSVGISESNNLTDSDVSGIYGVKYDNNTSQSYIGNFNEEYYAQFTKYNESIANGEYFTTSSASGNYITVETNGTIFPPLTGTSRSSVAMVNAVNAALCFAFGGENE